MALLNFFSHGSRPTASRVPLYLFNTLGKEKQEFTLPVRVHEVRMYNCGPTVYGVQHIGNLSMFVFTDILRRTLEYNGFKVKQVINITDFGHLTSDADEGEDKMTKGLKREKMRVTMANMAKLAEKYTAIFLDDLKALNIDISHIEFPRASAYIAAEIAMVQTLIEKGYAYDGENAVYYDTSRFPAYGELGGIDLSGLKEGARVAASAEKHHPTDFVLWKKDAKLGWKSPWGKGFPGWHIECSAMINSCLGKQIDIHTGGIEHVAIHHNNEIAQSEAATGKHPLSRFWMHRNHIQIEGSKIAKSDGNVVYLSEIIERGFHPFALRYLFLGAHYRAASNFSWDALEATQNALARILAIRISITETPGETPKKYQKRFHERINDDLDTPGALAVMWEMAKDESLAPADILAGLIEFDRIFGIGITEPDGELKRLGLSVLKVEIDPAQLPEEVRAMIAERETARASRDFHTSDAIRSRLDEMGYTLEDSVSGTRIFKKQ
ncbi:MAG TPA: cysteine--tRNA ligase [Candidatus Paceibacterota bacterium]|nr:cysteine--tRNA ligase [Candidatus Paceibacterota bacterium]